jgi:diguanylate cyclase (GGDEF)-like protein
MSKPDRNNIRSSPQAASLENLRFRVYASVFPIGIIALSAISILEHLQNLATPLDDLAHPFMAAVFACFGLLVWARRSLLRPIEIASFVIVSGYMLLELYQLLYISYLKQDISGFAAFPQWLPIVYFLAFLMFRTRSAVLVSIVFFAGAMVPGAMYVIAFGADSLHYPEFQALAQLYFSHAIYIPLLSGISLLKERYVRAAMLAQSMVQVANRDYLTNTDNRRYLEQTLTLAIERARRYGRLLMVITIDIDHFKRVNDTYGHDVGDEVLIELATLIRGHLRTADSFGRWGGEEFLVIAPEIDLARAVLLAERLRSTVAEYPFSATGRLTASFGVTGYRAGDTVDTMIKRADIALYRAKQRGRNRVELES